MIKLLPAPHERKYSELVSDYLLRSECQVLCLEFPREVEDHLNEYAKGERSYGRLRNILMDGEIISPPFEVGYRPLLRTLPELSEADENFRVHCYEKFDVYNDWVFSRDELVVWMLTSENFKRLEDLHSALVRETRSRNKLIAQRIGEIASSSSSDLYVITGRLHAPHLVDRLEEDFELEEIVLEDLSMTPLDESIILELQGRRLGAERRLYLRKHRDLAREARERSTDNITELLRDDKMVEKFDLEKYSRLRKRIDSN